MLGKVYGKSQGLQVKEDAFVLVKKVGKKGEKIPKHNHEEALVLFTLLQGKVKVLLDEKEEHLLEAGQLLQFDGLHFIQAEFLEDGEVFVTLVHKK